MLPLPGTQTRTDGGSLRRAPSCASAPGRTARVATAEELEVRLGLPRRQPPGSPQPPPPALSPGGGAADGNV